MENEILVVVGKQKGVTGNKYFFCFTSKDETMKDRTIIPKGTVITFSTRIWSGEILPEPGQEAILGGIQKFAKGWRASNARPITF